MNKIRTIEMVLTVFIKYLKFPIVNSGERLIIKPNTVSKSYSK